MKNPVNLLSARTRVIIASFFTCLVIASPVFSQTMMSVSDVATYAVVHSREIAAAEEAVENARDTLSEVFNLDKSSLTLSSGYNYTTPPEHTGNVEGSLSVPIIPELSVSANLLYPLSDTNSPSGSLRLNYNPFGDTSTEWRDWETLRKAEIQLDNLRVSVPMSAEEAALTLIQGQLDLKSAERAIVHAENGYEIAKKRYELQDMTYTELEGMRTAASTARQNYYNSQKALLALKKNLYQIIGPDLGDIEVSELSTDNVLLMISARETELMDVSVNGAATINLLNQVVELEALKQQLEATPVFQPTISVSGNASYPFSTFTAGASVSVTLSPDQIKTEEREEIGTAIADKEIDLILEQANVDLEVRMLNQSISVAREALSISISDYENSEIQYKEANLLFDRGERTEFELEESGLSLLSSSIRLFSSAVDLYNNLGDLLQLYLLN